MNKNNYFSFLKLVLCFLVFATFGVVFGVTINEPDSIKCVADNEFYVKYNSERGLYFGIECLTKQNLKWWEKRLAYDVYFSFPPKPEEKTSSRKTADSLQALEEMFNSMSDVTAQNFYSPFWKEIESNKEFQLLKKSYKPKTQKPRDFDQALIGAFEGFGYNLEHYEDGGKGATWVAYVSSKPVNGLLCSEKDFDATSPFIKMAMTVKISSHFYTPLGIHRSPISYAFDQMNENLASTKNLSMLLHAFVARMVGEHIMPGVKYMVFRPLPAMQDIIASSKINFSKSNGQEAMKAPHIRCKTDVNGRPQDFSLIAPCNDTVYKLGKNHWFCTSQPIGNVANAFIFAIAPFIIIDRTELAVYGYDIRSTLDKYLPKRLSVLVLQYAGLSNVCSVCYKTSDKPFQQCSICKKVHYCSRDCQKKDWPDHKKVCLHKEE